MEHQEQLIMTAVGPDRIGLVEQIAEAITQQECNIEDSKMAAFCGEFALILLITGGRQALNHVADRRQSLSEQTGLNITLKTPSPRKLRKPRLPYRLTASCMDHPGVVYRVSGLLSKLAINIESMETKTYAAPVSGTPIFSLEAHVTVPTDLNINTLRGHLEEIERQENIDIELSMSAG